MNKTHAVRLAIQEKLASICTDTYFSQADADASLPYLVYIINEISCEYGLTLCELEVNAVDYGKDTSVCDALADTVQTELDQWLYIDDDVEFTVYRDRRQIVTEEDRNIIRRRMTFEVRMHERG